MTPHNNIETNLNDWPDTSPSISTRILFLMIGGGIGAALALLFAPKSGRELRTDISAAAEKTYSETLDAATQLRENTSEYLESAKHAGREVLGVVAARVSAVREEVQGDVRKIGSIVEENTECSGEEKGRAAAV